jgi:serine phosphatase RsbU (regulator of sigma subunit)
MSELVLTQLIALDVAFVLVVALFAGILWWRHRTALHRAMFLVWLAAAASLVAQGAFQHGDLAMVLAYTSVFLVTAAQANLVTTSLQLPVVWRGYVVVLAVAVCASVAIASRGAEFTPIALPVAFAGALPLVHTTIRAIRARWRDGGAAQRAFLVTCFVFGAHVFDFAFFRKRPELIPLGFALGMLLLFAFAITATAVVLEAETAQRARIATELDAARRIQSKLVPRDISLPGLEVLAHVRPADSVGGDYVDAYHVDPWSWLLLGDVTGHGLGAGLVMLMAQSTISSILHAQPAISPRELNALANKVLHANLSRLDEQRHMTIVAIRGRDHCFEVSGSHDNIYIYRAATRTVETLAMTHFPLGLGFHERISDADIAQDAFELAPGDVLFLGTDGITEAAREGDHMRGIFGEAGVTDILVDHAHAPLATLSSRLAEKLDDFTRGVYHDDVAFLVARRVPASQPETR